MGLPQKHPKTLDGLFHGKPIYNKVAPNTPNTRGGTWLIKWLNDQFPSLVAIIYIQWIGAIMYKWMITGGTTIFGPPPSDVPPGHRKIGSHARQSAAKDLGFCSRTLSELRKSPSVPNFVPNFVPNLIIFCGFFWGGLQVWKKRTDHEPCPDMNALIVNWIFSSKWKLNLRDNHCLMVSIPTFSLFEDPFLQVNIHIPSGCWNLHNLLYNLCQEYNFMASELRAKARKLHSCLNYK